MYKVRQNSTKVLKVNKTKTIRVTKTLVLNIKFTTLEVLIYLILNKLLSVKLCPLLFKHDALSEMNSFAKLFRSFICVYGEFLCELLPLEFVGSLDEVCKLLTLLHEKKILPCQIWRADWAMKYHFFVNQVPKIHFSIFTIIDSHGENMSLIHPRHNYDWNL